MSRIPIERTSQEIDNWGFDETYNEPTVEIVGEDSENSVLRRIQVTPEGSLLTSQNGYAMKVTAPDANTTYMAIAACGSSQSSYVWQCKKILISGADTIITWADGNNKFDNQASDLAALSYS